ncbi:RND efflux system, outer membrane lipoprotein, NodT family [Oxalobacteraceae bacterium IMCC9480]|nr:RND efflux system, outer membrane lipoprotein, NodT family [Oxalobacteraceae bacterium IMCC9480]
MASEYFPARCHFHKEPMNPFKLCALLWLGGCAIAPPPARVDAGVAPGWSAPLPHQGSLTDLTRWWQQQGDPLLVQLIDAGQAVSPSVASAAARISQARAVQVSASAALVPALNATASGSRNSAQPGIPLSTTVQGALQASWEIDVFGARRFAQDSARARLDGAQAGWHDARVSVAADIANQYYGLRACQRLLEVTRADAASRTETARLSQLSATAGFTAPATAALARASAAEASGRVTQQQAQCDIGIKTLVALTAVAEPDLRQQLGDLTPAALFTPIAITSLPAATLRQRPDVFNAEREVAAASAAVGNAQAQRYPRLTLGGSVGAGAFRAVGVTTEAPTWAIGPLAVSLPLFDAGTRVANIDAARASYDEAVVLYRARVRQAVREVEEALVNLDSTARRSDDAARAVDGYRLSFNGTENRYRSGLASLVELEDARRFRLAAELNQVALQQQRNAAWIALYRAAGGGWRAPDASNSASNDSTDTPKDPT